MANLNSSDIVEDVKQVLLSALRVKGSKSGFLTALQILERLPTAARDRLISERTLAGADAAPNVVASAASMLPGIIMEFIDSRGVAVTIGKGVASPGSALCELYRLDAMRVGVQGER